MKTITDIFGIILLAAIIWHMHVFFSDQKEVTGIFKASPKLGYIWTDDKTDEARAFWGNTDAHWQAGKDHPDYNVESAEQEGKWTPRAGYRFTNTREADLSTTWTENLKHPDMKAYSSATEGEWLPQIGYKFTFDAYGNAISTVWDAGKAYSDFKIKASNMVDRFEAFPGYTFSNPTENLNVRWTPGLPDPANPSLIAATTEGEWIDSGAAIASSEGPDQVMDGVVGVIFANVGEWLFGKNDITDDMREAAAKDIIVGGVKTIFH
nr:hypothetical protein [uncultured Dyadobacter sp.]